MSEAESTRHYTVVSLLGEGGFGKVYRARMEGSGGFTKEVAIKLLHDEDFPESVRRRFRDEARILGLVRDRAIVGVDPPVLLSGHWAIVMEYVDGVSASWLVKRGALPLTVALEILQEAARALDTVYRQAGPDGQPLRLVHRDLKPANLQITPTGAVKVLDFGIARAEFGGREARTRRHVGGTFGYIAPERLEGIDGPAGDVYALGVVLHEFVCGMRPGVTRRAATYTDESAEVTATPILPVGPDANAVIQLAARMRSLEPEDRPTTREVERECATLLKQLSGPTLRQWAEEHVPAGSPMPPDDRVGTQLTETSSETGTGPAGPTAPAPQGSGRSTLAFLLSGLLLVLVLVLALVTVGAGAIGVALYVNTDPVTAPASPSVPTAPEPPPAPEPTPEPPQPAPPTPPPEPTPAPAPPRVPPRPVAPAPAPAPAIGVTFAVTLTSVPLGASVVVDGRPVGSTPVRRDLGVGTHVIHMEFEGLSSDHSIQVGRRAPKRYIWRSEGDLWESIF